MKKFKYIAVPKTATTFIEVNFGGPQFLNQFYVDWSNIDTTPTKFMFDDEPATIEFVGHAWNYPTQIGSWYDWLNPERIQGRFHNMNQFELNDSETIVTNIRNPFDILFSMFNYNWGWCSYFHGFGMGPYDLSDFQKFVDIYLDKSKIFHAPAFRRSLFSQLKDIDGNWLLKDDSVVIRFENLDEDIESFRCRTNVEITNVNDSKNVAKFKKPCNWWEAYRKDQVEKLNELWKEDLEYFNYSYENPNVDDNPTTNVSVPTKLPKSKIALVFSGNIRDLNRTKDYWKGMIDKYNIDVYGSFWDIENKELDDTFDNFEKIYNPIKVEKESYTVFEESTLSILRQGIEAPKSLFQHLKDSTNSFGSLSMWYRIWRGNLMTKYSNHTYERVIRARTDTILSDDIDFYINDIINIPSARVKLSTFDNTDGLCDLFAFGPPNVMDYYSICFFFMMQHIHEGHYLVPHEHYLHTHMNRISVPMQLFKTDLIITRTSKGTEDEYYMRKDDSVNEFLMSDFMELIPNTNLNWKKSFKDNIKF